MFRDQYVNLVGRVSELEKISSSVEMVLEMYLKKVNSELVVLQGDKVITERKLT